MPMRRRFPVFSGRIAGFLRAKYAGVSMGRMARPTAGLAQKLHWSTHRPFYNRAQAQ